mgnify:FL=1
MGGGPASGLASGAASPLATAATVGGPLPVAGGHGAGLGLGFGGAVPGASGLLPRFPAQDVPSPALSPFPSAVPPAPHAANALAPPGQQVPGTHAAAFPAPVFPNGNGNNGLNSLPGAPSVAATGALLAATSITLPSLSAAPSGVTPSPSAANAVGGGGGGGFPSATAPATSGGLGGIAQGPTNAVGNGYMYTAVGGPSAAPSLSSTLSGGAAFPPPPTMGAPAPAANGMLMPLMPGQAPPPQPQQQPQQQQQQQQQQQPQSQTAGAVPHPQPSRPPNSSGSGSGGSFGPRIDPSTLPVFEAETRALVRTRGGEQLPPASSRFTVIDQGNASPRFLRLTAHAIPAEAAVMAKTKIAVGGVLQPLAATLPGDTAVELASVTAPEGPVRCRGCRAYVNPFFRFQELGAKMVCNLCELTQVRTYT